MIITLSLKSKVVTNFSCCSARDEEDAEASAFDSQSSAVIKLNNATILYLREVNKYLALVCILREDAYDRQGEMVFLVLTRSSQICNLLMSLLFPGLIDYNFHCFRKGIQQVFELRNKMVAMAAANHPHAPSGSDDDTSKGQQNEQTNNQTWSAWMSSRKILTIIRILFFQRLALFFIQSLIFLMLVFFLCGLHLSCLNLILMSQVFCVSFCLFCLNSSSNARNFLQEVKV